MAKRKPHPVHETETDPAHETSDPEILEPTDEEIGAQFHKHHQGSVFTAVRETS